MRMRAATWERHGRMMGQDYCSVKCNLSYD
jgi:hypothetical protein